MLEKIKRLEEIKGKLKKDFVGIDDVIDKIVTSVSPWYLTPEVIERPLVISLWGLTGTGKTSLVRKLVEYLDLSERMVYFDCGEHDKDSGQTISDIIDNSFGEEEFLGGPLDKIIFVFDEFQCARTINQHGEEESKANLRAMWSIMDSGILNINDYRYDVVKFSNFVDDLEQFIKDIPGVTITDGYYDPQYIPEVMRTLGLFHYDYKLESPFSEEYDEEGDEKENKKLEILPNYLRRTLISYLTKYESGLGFKTMKELQGCKTLGDYFTILKGADKIIRMPKKIDCSKGLVFVLGNLDEAYGIHDDISPDVEADMFRSITEDIGITEVKTALQERFRNEQIGRFGNNIITYPSLSKKNFQDIIEKEVSRVFDKFKPLSGLQEIKVGKNFKNLIYAEGVFPAQGVRPVLSTIGNLLTSRLSKIIQEKTSDTVSVEIETKSKIFDKDYVDIFITFYDTSGNILKEVKEKENLSLGKLRNVDNCGRIAAQAVHEASHSVVYLKLMNRYPSSIVAVSSMGGGVMYMDYKKFDDITSHQEVDNNVKVSLAGYLGEKLFFSEEKCLMGSGNDIKSAWEELSDAFYRRGYVSPMFYTSSFSDIIGDGLPIGMIDQESSDWKNEGIRIALKNKFESLIKETEELLGSEKELIKEMALYLVKNRTMSTQVFKNMVKKYSKTMNIEQIKKDEKNLNNYYLDALKKG